MRDFPKLLVTGFALEKVRSFIGFLLLAAALTACQSKDAKIDPLAGGGGLTGKWVSSDNVFTAQLANGTFVSTANDTGEILSQGQYVVKSAKEVQLTWEGRVSRQSNIANCQRDGEAVLNCTDKDGRTFILRKMGAVG